jgi:hypothetical protein
MSTHTERSRWITRWGTTEAERQKKLPGDDLVPDVREQLTYAVTIKTPEAAIWPWLVQLGQGRGGWYSYAWIENVLGAGIHNVDRIHPEWQHLQVGDTVRMYREGGGPPPYEVVALEPERALLLGHRLGAKAPVWGESWAFVLQRIDERSTRLMSRERFSASLPPALQVLNYFLTPGYFLMCRKMLLGIKQRAERTFPAEQQARKK